jgi:4-hydroxy-tetrahydrodipicolinate reductase
MTGVTIKVLVSGSGRMGREVLSAVAREPDMDPVGCVDLLSSEDHISVAGTDRLIPFGQDAAAMIARVRPDVIVDFTSAEWTPRLAKEALAAGVRLVIGTTGLSDAFVKELETGANKRGVGVVVAPNFALGAVLMQYMATVAARFYSHAEIIEMHHAGKIDSPSGTSLATARAMAAAKREPFTVPKPEKEPVKGARGATETSVTIHSVRLPGLVAHQEVIFGGPGETLTIRHDTTNRESFMPGVILAVREVMKRNDFVYGLDRLFGLT